MSFISTITLPPSIEDVIAKKLENTDSEKWIQRALVLSDKYRQSHKTENHSEYEDEVFIEEANDVLGYLALRSPSTYAQLFSALCNIAEMLPSWQPLSILDMGSGPGTALWAASEIWPSLTTGTCIERDYNFCKMGKEISQSSLPHPMELEWLSSDIASSQPQLEKQYDLVILGNVLNEIESVKRNSLLEFASAHCNGVLLVVESGTPYGCEVVQQAATKMNSLEGVFLAPYIENSLVVSSSHQFRFPQKVTRPDFHRRTRQIQRKLNSSDGSNVLPASDWEKVIYSYVAKSKIAPEFTPWARVLAMPQVYNHYLELKLLTKNGIENPHIERRDKKHYKFAKKLKWGELIASPESIR